MKYYKFDFSDYEQKKNDELENIMNDWILQVSTKNKGTLDNGNKTKLSPASCFAKDGFFPGYFSQKRKILFIGREPRNIGGFDFRDTTKKYFADLKNNNSWWRHMVLRKKGNVHLKILDVKKLLGYLMI